MMAKKLWRVSVCLLLVGLLCLSAEAQNLPLAFSTGKKGTIRVRDIRMYPIQYAWGWKSARHAVDPSFTNLSNVAIDGWEFKSALLTKNNTSLNLQHKIHADQKTASINWQINATSPQPVNTALLAMCVDIPVSGYAGQTIKVDDKLVTLTEQASTKSQVMAVTSHVKRIEITTAQGPVIFEGDWRVEITDRRRWKTNVYSIRFYFSPSRGKITRSAFAMKVIAKGYTCFPLSFEEQCNMGFKDQRAGDQVGGWSDQGAENDLAAMKVGRHVYSGIEMNVIDPAKNNGKSCMVFECGKRPYFLKTARVDVPKNSQASQARTLMLLHTSAWGNHAGTQMPISVIQAHYTDGSTHDIPIMFGRELGDWWGANSKSNGRVVWSAPNGQAFVGAYLSRFELPAGKNLDHFTIQSNGRCVWGVLAMTLCKEDVPLPSEQFTPMIVTAGKIWKPLKWTQEVVPGSILDFTSQYPQPSGGIQQRIVARNGQFEYENKPGQTVRLHGVNLVFEGNYVSHKDSERLARQLQMRGFNIVRLHHFDRGLLDKNGPNSHTLDPEKMDRLCYMISQFKKHGLYITWDLYSFRNFRAEDSMLNRKYFREIKILATFDPLARKALTDFAEGLLRTVNPYTDMALADDPVLATTSTMNEDMLMKAASAYPDVKVILHKAYAKWIKANHPNEDPKQILSPLYTRFIYELAVSGHTALRESLKQMGVRTPFSGNNADKMQAANLLNNTFDYVDSHFYHDHPSFVDRRWNLPYAFSCASATRQMASSLRMLFPVRRLDMPYAITEYSHVMPNPYRAEAGPLIGAYASFQNWGMLCRFQWAGEKPKLMTQPGIMDRFSIVNDPVSLMSEQILSLLFRRADVASAKKTIAYVTDIQDVFTQGKDRAEYPSEYSRLGLVTGVGNITRKKLSEKLPANCVALVGDKAMDGKLKTKLPFISQNHPLVQAMVEQGIIAKSRVSRRYTSDTDELQIDASVGSFQAVTPRSEVVVLSKAGSHQAKVLNIVDASGPVTLCLAAMDDKTVKTSGRLLLMHLTNTLNTQMKFRDQHGRIVESWGRLPLLVKKGTAKIQLAVDNAANVQVHAVDLAGKRIGQLQTKVDAKGKLLFTINTHGMKADGVMAYELIRK